MARHPGAVKIRKLLLPQVEGARGRTWTLDPWKRGGPKGPTAVGMQHGPGGWLEIGEWMSPPLSPCILQSPAGTAHLSNPSRCQRIRRLGILIIEVSLLGVHDSQRRAETCLEVACTNPFQILLWEMEWHNWVNRGFDIWKDLDSNSTH